MCVNCVVADTLMYRTQLELKGLTEEQFHALAQRVRDAGVKFIIEPHLRFQGQPGEQWTMFFKDPSGNNLEFKAMTGGNKEFLFKKFDKPLEEPAPVDTEKDVAQAPVAR